MEVDDDDWKTIPDYNWEDTSQIEAMSREQLEHQLVRCGQHLVDGMKIMRSCHEKIGYLERTVVMLCEQLQTLHPELKDVIDELKDASGIETD